MMYVYTYIRYTYIDIYRQLAIKRKSPDRFSLLFRFVLYCFDPFLFGSPLKPAQKHNTTQTSLAVCTITSEGGGGAEEGGLY